MYIARTVGESKNDRFQERSPLTLTKIIKNRKKHLEMYFHISKLVFGDWSTTWDHVLKVLGHGLNQVFFSKNLAWPVFNITFFPLNSWTWCFSHMLILYISVAVNQTDRIVWNKHMAKTSRSRVKGKKTWLLKKDADFRKLENLCRQEKNDCAKTRKGIGLKFWPSVCALMYAMYTSFQRCTTIFAVSGTVYVAVIFTFATVLSEMK